MALLKVDGLVTEFQTAGGRVRAVDGVSFEMEPGKTLCLVGESGCGKSVTSLSILRLIRHPGTIAAGSITFEDRDLLKLPEKEMRKIRGDRIAMVFQEPMTSLNPVFTVGQQIVETLRVHRTMKKREARNQAIGLLEKVGIPSPEVRIDEYPHQLSGGMKQRVMIAMALSCNPSVLIADEPTTALDVTIQAQILDLLRSLQKELGMAILLVTHDLGVVAEMADRVAVMYAGRIVEEAAVEPLFENPKHPYTLGLFQSIPKPESERGSLTPISGNVPNPIDLPKGCRFGPRCPIAEPKCEESDPELLPAGEGRTSACHFSDRVKQGEGVA